MEQRMYLNGAFLLSFRFDVCEGCGCLEEACICDEPDPARGEGEI